MRAERRTGRLHWLVIVQDSTPGVDAQNLFIPVTARIPPLNRVKAMISRYSRPEMAAIWSPETRFRIWFEIEAHAADAMAELGIIPKEAAKKVWEKARTPSSTWRASTPSRQRSSTTSLLS